MPWCPKCRVEFRPGFARCTDCDVALVASLDEAPPSAAEEPESAPEHGVWFWADGPEVARVIEGALNAHSIPCLEPARAPDGRWRVLVALDYLSAASHVLTAAPGIAADPSADEIVYRRIDPARDETIRDHPVLRVPLPDLRARVAQVMPDLQKCALRGNGDVRERAVQLLFQLDTPGRQAWLDLLLPFIDEGWLPGVGALLHEHRKLKQPGPVEPTAAWLDRLRAAFRSEKPEARAAATHVGGSLRLTALVPDLIALLRDEENAADADEALLQITGEDLGFDPELPEDERERIIAAREVWWQKRCHSSFPPRK